jgi:hypothetical protein
VNAARRTLGCWILSAFLERGCDGAAARLPREVWSVRSLSAGEMAALSPLGPLGIIARMGACGAAGEAIVALVPLSNLRRMPDAGRREPPAGARRRRLRLGRADVDRFSATA